MKKNSRLLLFVFIGVIASAITWNYSVYFLERNFIITDRVACDPVIESCFMQDCDSSDPACDSEPYKRIVKNAAYVNACPNYILEKCPALTCKSGEPDCTLTLCYEGTVGEGEVCIYTPEFASKAENPPVDKLTK